MLYPRNFETVNKSSGIVHIRTVFRYKNPPDTLPPWEYDNLIQSLYLLNYIDSASLRPNVQRAVKRSMQEKVFPNQSSWFSCRVSTCHDRDRLPPLSERSPAFSKGIPQGDDASSCLSLIGRFSLVGSICDQGGECLIPSVLCENISLYWRVLAL